MLEKCDTHLNTIDEDTRITQKALLTLLKRAQDGNDIESLKNAERDLKRHLTDK